MPDTPIENIARGVLIYRDALLVCRNVKHGHIFLPGGHIEPGEPARVALQREMQEELGVDMKATDFLGVCEASFVQQHKSGPRRHHEINCVFRLEVAELPPEQVAGLASQERAITFDWIAEVLNNDQSPVLLPDGIDAFVRNAGRSENAPSFVSAWL